MINDAGMRCFIQDLFHKWDFEICSAAHRPEERDALNTTSQTLLENRKDRCHANAPSSKKNWWLGILARVDTAVRTNHQSFWRWITSGPSIGKNAQSLRPALLFFYEKYYCVV